MGAMNPCAIVSNDVGNRVGSLVIVVAVTSNLRAPSFPIGVLLPSGTAGLPKESVAHCGHVYTVDKARLNSKMGVLPDPFMVLVDRALRVSLAL